MYHTQDLALRVRYWNKPRLRRCAQGVARGEPASGATSHWTETPGSTGDCGVGGGSNLLPVLASTVPSLGRTGSKSAELCTSRGLALPSAAHPSTGWPPRAMLSGTRH